MNTTEYMYDKSAGSRILRSLILSEHPVRKQDARARSGIRLDHVKDRLAKGLDLLRAERSENAVIDGVVEEQDLGGFDEN